MTQPVLSDHPWLECAGPVPKISACDRKSARCVGIDPYHRNRSTPRRRNAVDRAAARGVRRRNGQDEQVAHSAEEGTCLPSETIHLVQIG
jgi:hypothetical protein